MDRDFHISAIASVFHRVIQQIVQKNATQHGLGIDPGVHVAAQCHADIP
ncbi:hypothetical protein [Paraburkholderia kirstenboschensis]